MQLYGITVIGSSRHIMYDVIVSVVGAVVAIRCKEGVLRQLVSSTKDIDRLLSSSVCVCVCTFPNDVL